MNNNQAIAALFEEIAGLLEIEEANPFRIRAYRNAARTLSNLADDIGELIRSENFRLPGIGPDLKQKIEEYLSFGRIAFRQELTRKTPAIVREMLAIPGVGPKTANLLYRKFAPKDLRQLRGLAEAGKIAGLAGIKDKTQQNLLEGLRMLEQHSGRNLLSKALAIAESLVKRLAALPGVQKIQFSGSLRRMKETVRDIDILIISRNPEPIMKAFVGQPGIHRVLASGGTKSSVVSAEGVQIDLRVVPPASFGAALLYFTGSKAHNIRLRTLAKKRGLKINEYGLFESRSGKKIAGKTEEEMYRALGLDFIPPELREDAGEIEAARNHSLPALLEAGDIRGDFHSHSKSTDGMNEIDEMAEAARKRRLEYLVLTDHSQSLKVAHGLSPREVLKQRDRIRALDRKMKGFTLLCGAEVDILGDGSLDYKDDLLKELDFVVASVHSGFKQSEKQLTERIIKAMRNKYVHVIGHPTGRLIGERESYPLDMEAVVRSARETNTALEINSHPSRLDLNDRLAFRARENGVMLAVNTDSHAVGQFENLRYGVAMARRAWCGRENILNCLPLAELRKRIRK
jgi:DNA polymerase (family 10)